MSQVSAHAWVLKHNSRFWPARMLTRDILSIRLYRGCYIGPFKYGTWVLSGVSKGGLRVLKHRAPLSSGTKARSVAQWQLFMLIIDNWYIARTNNKLTGLENSLSKQLFLVATWPKTAFFVSQLSSRTC